MVNCQPKIEEFDIVRPLSIKAFLFLFDHCEYSKAKKEQIIQWRNGAEVIDRLFT